MANNTVMLIEDDQELIPLIIFILERIGCAVVQSNAVTFLKDIQENDPKVIILDYWVPHKLGSTICEELKSNPEFKNIPILLTSAVNNIGAVAEACHADDVLAKPFDIGDLEDKIIRLLGKHDKQGVLESS